MYIHININLQPPPLFLPPHYACRSNQNEIFNVPDNALPPALHTCIVAAWLLIADTETAGIPFVPGVPEYVMTETCMTSDAKILELLNGKDSQALAAVVADTVVTMPEWVLMTTWFYCTKQPRAHQGHKHANKNNNRPTEPQKGMFVVLTKKRQRVSAQKAPTSQNVAQ